MIDFTEAHGWVDSMTRKVTISFSNYNPNTNTFTSSRIKCDFEVGGAIYCKQGVEVLRVGHYQNWNVAGGFRLFTEILILFATIYLAYVEVGEVLTYQTDNSGVVIHCEYLEETAQFEYEVRMSSGTILSFAEEKLRAKATQFEITSWLRNHRETGDRVEGFRDIYNAYKPMSDEFKSWFAQVVTPRIFKKGVRLARGRRTVHAASQMLFTVRVKL